MAVRVLRRCFVALMMMMLAAPAWTVHVCSCAHRVVKSGNSAAQEAGTNSAPLRACCAQRLAGKSAPPSSKSSQPGLKAKCCCGDIRWNVSAAKIPLPRAEDKTSELASVACDDLPAISTSAVSVEGGTSCQSVRAGPIAALHIVLCRAQV